jgi:hypothetical protein
MFIISHEPFTVCQCIWSSQLSCESVLSVLSLSYRAHWSPSVPHISHGCLCWVINPSVGNPMLWLSLTPVSWGSTLTVGSWTSPSPLPSANQHAQIPLSLKPNNKNNNSPSILHIFLPSQALWKCTQCLQSLLHFPFSSHPPKIWDPPLPQPTLPPYSTMTSLCLK